MGATDSVVDASTTDADVMNITSNANIAATTLITNVETLNLSALGNLTVDMTKITGVTALNTTGSTGTVTISNLSSATTGFGFAGTGTNTIAAGYVAGTLSGIDAIALTATSAKGVTFSADAGFESASLGIMGAGNTITSITTPGVTSLTITGTGDSTIAANGLVGISTVTVTNTAAMKLGAIATTPLSTLSATANTGGITGSTALVGTNIYSTDNIAGATTGLTMLLGSGVDNLMVTEAAASTKSNTIKLGAGNDILDFTNAGAGATYIFGEAGDDTVKVGVAALETTDLIDLGTGTADKLVLDNSLTNNLTLRGVEQVDLSGTGATQTFANDDSATAVNMMAATADNLNVATLSAGSTVAINELVAGSAAILDSTTVGFAATEAATTIDFNVEVDDAITVSKVTALTLDFEDASSLAGGEALTIDDTTSLNIMSAKALDLGDGIASAATDALDSITATTTTGALDLGDILNSDKLQTLTATSAAALTITGGDNAVAGAALLDTVTLVGTSMALGTFGNTTAAADLTSFTATASTGSIVFTTTVNDDAAINATKLGTVTLSAAAGSIQIDDGTTDGNLVTAADSTGITVDLTAKTSIGGATLNTNSAVVTNTKGNITASLAGAANAMVNYTAGAGGDATIDGVVNLMAANTGGLTNKDRLCE